MKKALTGCLVVVLLAVVVGGAAGYWFVLRPAWNAGSAFMDNAKQWQQIAEMDKQVRNDDSFDAPGDGRLSAAQVDRFLEIQRAIVNGLGNDWTSLDARYKQMNEERKTAGREMGLQETLQAYSDLSGLVLTAKKAQVESLNRSGMSLAEYRWLRQQAFQALPLTMADKIPDAMAGSSTAANAELLKPYKAELQKSLATSILGF